MFWYLERLLLVNYIPVVTTKTIELPTKYIPLLNLTLDVVLVDLFLDGDIKTNAFQRIIIGLSASGLFDHTKIMKKDVDTKGTR
ncbi:holin [Bacillus toyonensis]|uniref:holin n=1 Tax=Bacillus toyonensis TaxID=155322 RepID=UPI003D64B7C5